MNIPSITNALVEKTQALQNDLVSTNETTNNPNALINIITKPDNIEEVASLLEAYFEGINTTAQANNSQDTQDSVIVNTAIENETFPLQEDLALNEHNSENELAIEDGPTDSNPTPEWSLNIGEPTELIVVKQFAETYATAFEQEISEIRNISSSSKKLSKTQGREIAEKCSVQECLKLSSQFFADPTLFSLLRQYYSIDGNKAQNGTNVTLPPLSSSSTGETDENTSQNKSKGESAVSNSRSSRKRKSVSDECDVQGKEGRESSLRAQRNKRIKRQSKKCDTQDGSNNVASSSQSGTSNSTVPTVSISAITAAASGSKGIKSRRDIDSSERPEQSAMEKRFWEMAALLDSSPLASLNSKYRSPAPVKKRNDLNYVSSIISKKSDTIKEIDNCSTEVVLSVAFYNQSNPPSRTQEFLVLGSQSLAVLRDAFYCVSDFYKPEVSELSASVNALNSHEEKKSGSYFFIEDVFYNDCRDKDALDYSKTIVDWVNKNERYTNPGLGLYQRKNMDEITFSDLSIRLNQPYLFVHKGDCEHAIVFTDLRMWNKPDGVDANAFPKATFKCKIIRHKCRMCITRPATLVTINDFMAGETPAFFCDQCYNEFHYDSDSNLLYDNYKVFRYAHD